MMRSFPLNFNNQFSFFSIDCWCGKFKKGKTQRQSITVRWKERKYLFVDVIFFYSVDEGKSSKQHVCCFFPGIVIREPAQNKENSRRRWDHEQIEFDDEIFLVGKSNKIFRKFWAESLNLVKQLFGSAGKQFMITVLCQFYVILSVLATLSFKKHCVRYFLLTNVACTVK